MFFFKKHSIFFLTLIIVVTIGFFRQSKGIVQQDNYVGYAHYLSTDFSQITHYDSRLYAGLPILINFFNLIFNNSYVSGLIISYLLFTASYFVLYAITKSKYSFIPLIFPPIMLSQVTKIATEFPAIFLFLCSIYFMKKENWRMSFLTLGSTIWFRHNIIPLLPVYLYFRLKQTGFKNIITESLWFVLSVVLFFYFNAVILQTGNPLYPYTTYLSIETQRYVFGFWQLIEDFFINIKGGDLRIVFSGSVYFLLICLLFYKSYQKVFAGKNIFLRKMFVIVAALLIFNLSLGYNPFLSEYSRYMVYTFPLFYLLLNDKHNEIIYSKYWPLILFLSTIVVII